MMGARTWAFGDGINTDMIVAGKHMKLPIPDMLGHCLHSVRPAFASGVRPGDVLVAGKDFGIGSSRDQAAQVLRMLGVTAIVAESFSGIFYRNAFNWGLVAVVCPRAGTIPDGVAIEVDAAAGRIVLPDTGTVLACEPVPDFLLDLARQGGLLASLKARRRA